jgi:hypothetical protein
MGPASSRAVGLRTPARSWISPTKRERPLQTRCRRSGRGLERRPLSVAPVRRWRKRSFKPLSEPRHSRGRLHIRKRPLSRRDRRRAVDCDEVDTVHRGRADHRPKPLRSRSSRSRWQPMPWVWIDERPRCGLAARLAAGTCHSNQRRIRTSEKAAAGEQVSRNPAAIQGGQCPRSCPARRTRWSWVGLEWVGLG